MAFPRRKKEAISAGQLIAQLEADPEFVARRERADTEREARIDTPDRRRLLAALTDAGVSGVEDFGVFVNNTKYFAPSRFDGAAAAPILLAELPRLTDERLVATVGRHLQIKRVGTTGYGVVRDAFRRWAGRPGEAGWVLGDTLARMADKTRADDFLELATEDRYGSARAWIVDALWRFKSVADVEPVLRDLIRDPEVSLHAMTALQRTVGAGAMGSILRELLASGARGQVADNAARQLKRIEKKQATGSA